MSDTANAIMDAAERRIRQAGYNGFSFREIAADVGIKSASVHYHFPTKEALAAAVARRYTDRFAEAVDQQISVGRGLIGAWRRVFQRALREDGKICLCGALAAESQGLPKEVAIEVKRFFQLGMEKLIAGGLPRDRAIQVLATLEGAMLMANVLGHATAFDQATAAIERMPDSP